MQLQTEDRCKQVSLFRLRLHPSLKPQVQPSCPRDKAYYRRLNMPDLASSALREAQEYLLVLFFRGILGENHWRPQVTPFLLLYDFPCWELEPPYLRPQPFRCDAIWNHAQRDNLFVLFSLSLQTYYLRDSNRRFIALDAATPRARRASDPRHRVEPPKRRVRSPPSDAGRRSSRPAPLRLESER